jgi:hypothetical protein
MNQPHWKSIKTGVGYADHIPAAIAGLGSDREEERKKAYGKLDNYAIIQSDLYEAAYYIIDPVLESLSRAYTYNRYYSFLVLIEIVRGFAPEEDTILLNDGDTIVQKSLHKACLEKFKMNKNNISEIVVMDDNEREEKRFLLESIDEKCEEYLA